MHARVRLGALVPCGWSAHNVNNLLIIVDKYEGVVAHCLNKLNTRAVRKFHVELVIEIGADAMVSEQRFGANQVER